MPRSAKHLETFSRVVFWSSMKDGSLFIQLCIQCPLYAGNILSIGDTRQNKQNPCSHGTYNSNWGKNKQIRKKIYQLVIGVNRKSKAGIGDREQQELFLDRLVKEVISGKVKFVQRPE